MPLRSFANLKMSRHRKEFRGAPQARGPTPWTICRCVNASLLEAADSLSENSNNETRTVKAIKSATLPKYFYKTM